NVLSSIDLLYFYSRPPQPESTLFPYTTLFRSRHSPGCRLPPGGVMRRRLLVSMISVTVLAVVALGVPLGLAAARVYRDRDGENRDRKSTRLNSSHVAISYAVFCLKKKKRNTQH